VIKKANKSSLKKDQILSVLEILKNEYPDAHCALDFKNPYELLVATILSAQCTDERVNQVTPSLFKKYPNPKTLAQAEIEDLEKLIHSTGFYKNKSKNLKACAEKLVEKYDGLIPKDLMDLVSLPGVGRKTANVVLGNAYGISSGVVVDTHVTRLSNRLGWVKSENAVQIEQKLNKLIPQEFWIMTSHWLIAHGRGPCKARKAQCSGCLLKEICPASSTLKSH
jgi:endonuclease-3